MKSTGLTLIPDSTRINLDGEGVLSSGRSSGVCLRCGSVTSASSSSEDTVASLIVDVGGSTVASLCYITETSRSSSSEDTVGSEIVTALVVSAGAGGAGLPRKLI